MSDLIQRAYNTAEQSLIKNGKLTNAEAPPELLAYLREGMRDYPGAKYLKGGKFPYDLPKFMEQIEVRYGEDIEMSLHYKDFVNLTIPTFDDDMGNIPEVEYSDNPLLDAGPLSSRRYRRLQDELKNLFVYPTARDPGKRFTQEEIDQINGVQPKVKAE